MPVSKCGACLRHEGSDSWTSNGQSSSPVILVQAHTQKVIIPEGVELYGIAIGSIGLANKRSGLQQLRNQPPTILLPPEASKIPCTDDRGINRQTLREANEVHIKMALSPENGGSKSGMKELYHRCKEPIPPTRLQTVRIHNIWRKEVGVCCPQPCKISPRACRLSVRLEPHTAKL